MNKLMCVIAMVASSFFYSSGSLAYQLKDTVEVDGVSLSSVKISSDGTGVVTNIECDICSSKVATIDRNTKIYINGKLMNNTNVKNARKGNDVYVVIQVKTNKVLTLSFR